MHQTQVSDNINAEINGNVGEAIDREGGGVSGVVMGGAVVGLLLLFILLSVVGVVTTAMWIKYKKKHAAIDRSPREFCNAIYEDEGKLIPSLCFRYIMIQVLWWFLHLYIIGVSKNLKLNFKMCHSS